MRLRVIALAATASAAALALALLIVAFIAPERQATAERQQGEAPIHSEFTLVDHTGRHVTQADFAGRWQLVFFGFTSCPDICPTALATVSAALEELGDAAASVQPLFITVDPERDRPQVLADYVAAFDPRIVGLTGSPEQVAQAAKAFRIYFAKVEQPEMPGGYTMDHSGFLYLMDPQGRFATHFAHGEQPEKMAERIRAYLDGRKPVS